MKLYPTIEEVFEQPIDFYKTVFFPLLTIDLANINKGNGKVHFVTVWGNGNPEWKFKDDLFNYDFIKFDWTGEKYLFNGDLSSIENFDRLNEWYREAEQEYIENKTDYLTRKSFDEVDESHFYLQNERRESVSFEYYLEPTAAPSACTKRAKSNTCKSIAYRHKNEPIMYTTIPIIIEGLRPMKSESIPHKKTPKEKPTK